MNDKDISVIPHGFCCCGCSDDSIVGRYCCPYWEAGEHQVSATCNYLGVTDTEGYLFERVKICGIKMVPLELPAAGA